MSIYGHIVRVQGMNDKGLVVDDPYGEEQISSGVAWRTLKWNSKTSESLNGIAGEDNVWSWNKIEQHSINWIAIVKRGRTL